MIGKGDFEGLPFFYLARRYPDGASAKHAWDRLSDLGKRNKGKLDLGVFRIVPEGVGEPTVVALVSLGRQGVEFAAKVMGGEETDVIAPEVFHALMARRVRVVAPIYAKGGVPEGGQLVIRRGKRGARLRPDGTMDERIGQG
jgi:hypothetical protein